MKEVVELYGLVSFGHWIDPYLGACSLADEHAQRQANRVFSSGGA